MTTPILSPDPRFQKVVEALEEVRLHLENVEYIDVAKYHKALDLEKKIDAVLSEARKPLTCVGGMTKEMLMKCESWYRINGCTNTADFFKSIAETME